MSGKSRTSLCIKPMVTIPEHPTFHPASTILTKKAGVSMAFPIFLLNLPLLAKRKNTKETIDYGTILRQVHQV